jgi:hypothetical protein
MAAGGKSIGMAMKLARRKALLDGETSSTNAPRLVYHDDAETVPLYRVSCIRTSNDG